MKFCDHPKRYQLNKSFRNVYLQNEFNGLYLVLPDPSKRAVIELNRSQHKVRNEMNRRSFLQSSSAIAASVAATSIIGSAATSHAGEMTERIKKAAKFHMFNEDISAEDKLKIMKDVGYDGVECHSMLDDEEMAKSIAKASEKLDFPIHGVVNGNHPDLKGAIDRAKMFGASSILHVVGYDLKIPYLQNYRERQELILRAVDHAAKNKVHILIENVWATFLIEPLSMQRFVDEIDNPFVQVYFDIGNVVRWGWPQHWIEVLGSRIKKLDVKEYDLGVAMNEGMRAAFRKPLGEGSIDWALVRKGLLEIDYRGWATAEVPGGDRARMAQIAKEMDHVFEL